MDTNLSERLARHKLLAEAPADERAWLIEHGHIERYAVGDVIVPKGVPSPNLFIIFEGHVVIRVDRGAGSHKIHEWRGDEISGAIPYSRGAIPPGDVVVEEPTEVFMIPKALFPELVRECPVVTGILVHVMLDRAREFTSSDLRDEKLISLGKLAAGLAHELNNPASAVIRSSKSLSDALTDAEHAARQLARTNLSETEFAAIESMRVRCVSSQGSAHLSAMERADREEAISDWLADHSVQSDSVTALVDTGVSLDALDNLASTINTGALDATIEWIASCCAVRALSAEIEMAATRIYDLVAAVKGFSYMDHAPAAEPVDVRKGISDTLTMLNSKTRSKSVNVSVHFPDDLRPAHAVGAELNQVWMNLLDNALDAVPEGGHVDVKAENERGIVVVSITDDGPGIPEENQKRIFEPFFTTKGVGKGTGLGLDVTRRLLQRHDGGISVESIPGKTEFQVRLPAEKEFSGNGPKKTD